MYLTLQQADPCEATACPGRRLRFALLAAVLNEAGDTVTWAPPSAPFIEEAIDPRERGGFAHCLLRALARSKTYALNAAAKEAVGQGPRQDPAGGCSAPQGGGPTAGLAQVVGGG